jgi:prefoldin subunit 5
VQAAATKTTDEAIRIAFDRLAELEQGGGLVAKLKKRMSELEDEVKMLREEQGRAQGQRGRSRAG